VPSPLIVTFSVDREDRNDRNDTFMAPMLTTANLVVALPASLMAVQAYIEGTCHAPVRYCGEHTVAALTGGEAYADRAIVTLGWEGRFPQKAPGEFRPDAF